MMRSANSFRLSSRILCLAAAVFLLIPRGYSQSHSYRDADQIRKAVSAASRKAVKSGKSSDWMRLAEVCEDAYRFPLSNIVAGEGNSVRTLAVRGQRPREIMVQTDVDGIYKNVYSDKDICFDADGNLVAILVTRPVLDTVDVLERAFEAYAKAYETDRKGTSRKTVAEGFSRIAAECRTLGEMAAFFGRSDEAESWYLRAARISTTPPCEQPDSVALRVAEAVAAREHAAALERQRLEAVKASAWEIFGRGEALYREGLSLLEQAQSLPADDNKSFQALQKRLTACFSEAFSILQECASATDEEALRREAEKIMRPLRLYLGQTKY